jgi:hypothetical protein
LLGSDHEAVLKASSDSSMSGGAFQAMSVRIVPGGL